MMEERPFPRFSQELGVDIQKSWDGLTERLSVHKIGKIVFMNFFIKRPEVMPLFNKDVEKHGAMIAGMVDMAIQSIGDLKGLMPALISIGERHKDFGGGVKPEQFDALGDAFVDTLKDSLKEEFSPSMEKSWRTIFFFMSQVMQNAMNQAEINGSETGSGTGRSNTPSPKSQLQPPSPRAASAARNMELSRSDRSDSMKDDESLSKYRKDGKGDKDKCAVM